MCFLKLSEVAGYDASELFRDDQAAPVLPKGEWCMLQLMRGDVPVAPPMGAIVTICRTAPSAFFTQALYCQVRESAALAGVTEPSELTV